MHPLGAGTTLGVLAGGRATRLGGLDKAWLERDGVPQVLRLVDALAGNVDDVIVSANRNLSRYEGRGLRVVADRLMRAGQGPVAALDALASACTTEWLVTVPVDLVRVPADLVALLRGGCAPDAAYLHDADRPQPLVARWRVHALRAALGSGPAGAMSVHALHARIGSACVRAEAIALGNLNTPEDLAAAGVIVAP
ncbi:molybdenum cofactor guanylyltransferase [Cognatilysobacter bugurensis]|uniref:Molybdenum cofactor guanylyltransferase n=1 Tax=Cognatilysobacter bugurensis TaxID=543356 RepID=A0A918W6N6_9GAMM|nr:NTP transferase domain-containing protein [Lysobacter bugurensis]GHA74151.1 molybdenum cofactor guanylyltransferase [Lysobacter bugurensis]